MHISKRQEQFSLALVFAVASCAGCAIGEWKVDDDSIDITLRSKLFPRKPKIDLQLKCTWQDVFYGDEIHFFLPLNNYNDLRTEDVCVPRLLVTVLTPDDIDQWLHQSEEQMLLRNCAYWCDLRGLPPVENTNGRTVSFPRTNIFTPAALTNMMQHVNDTDLL